MTTDEQSFDNLSLLYPAGSFSQSPAASSAAIPGRLA